MNSLRTFLTTTRELCEKACPGPWRVNSVSDGIGRSVVTNQSHPLCEVSSAFHRQCEHGTGEDAEFIAASRERLPLALEIIEKMAEALEKIANHKQTSIEKGYLIAQCDGHQTVARECLAALDELSRKAEGKNG